jgi:hypothetical protein
MATVMTDNKHSQSVCALDAKQDCIWETVDETPANVFRNYAELSRIRQNSLNGPIDLGPQFISKSLLLAIVVRGRVV